MLPKHAQGSALDGREAGRNQAAFRARAIITCLSPTAAGGTSKSAELNWKAARALEEGSRVR